MPALPPKADFRQRSGLSEFQEFDRFPRAYAATGIPIRPSLGRTSREHPCIRRTRQPSTADARQRRMPGRSISHGED